MSEIVVAGQTFEIKGDRPTPQEQVAIDTYLKARNLDDEQTGIEDIDNGTVFITPEEILNDAERGKYNQDTETFLGSPTFKRIITEVGLSIAGGVAGAALAPFTGGGSLIGTAAAASRIARIARPLLNISARQVAKMGSGTVGAALGGGSGAAIAQAFDPKEDIVKEVARGALQGGFGEVLGFGMAGALGKVYNKVAGQKIQMIKGGRIAAQTIARQKAYYTLLEKASKGEKITEDVIAKTQSNLGKQLSEEQLKVLKDPELASKNVELLKEKRGADFFKRVEQGTLTPALITENNMIDTLENILGASFFGGGRMLNAQQGSRLGLLGGMDEFVTTVTNGVEKNYLNENTLNTLIQKAVTDSKVMYDRALNSGYKELAPLIREATEQTVNGKVIPKPGYGIDLSWDGVRKNYVFNTTTRQAESSKSLRGILQEQRKKLEAIRQRGTKEEALDLVSDFETMPSVATFDDVLSEYRTLSQRLDSGGNSPLFQQTGRAIQKILKAEMDRMNLPPAIRAEYNRLKDLTQMGPDMFNAGIFSRIAKTTIGQKKILDQILVKGKNDVAKDFFNKLRMTDTGITQGEKGAGKLLLKADEIKNIEDGIRGNFIKKFIADSTEAKEQYLYLRANKARDFVERDYKEFIDEGGLLTKEQGDYLKEFTNALKFADGAISAPGTKANRGTIFIQLKEMGALTQLGTVALAGQGYIDPGSALAFVLAPAALSRVFTNPKLMKFVVDGTKGTGYKDFGTFSRFMGQFGSALVSEGIIDEEENAMVQSNIKMQQDNLEKIFKNQLPDNTFYGSEETYNPSKEDPIPYNLNEQIPQRRENLQSATPTSFSLPDVRPSNVGFGQQPSRTELVQTLFPNFNKGGIASVRRK